MTKKSKISVALSVLAGIGVVSTAFLSAFETDRRKPVPDDATKKDKVIIFFKNYKFTIISGVITEVALVTSEVLDIQEIAALSGLVAVGAAKMKSLTDYLEENHPDILEEVRKVTAEKDIKEGFNKEETYDGRYKMYEPITQQTFFSKIPPKEMALECTNFINSSLLNDQIVSIYDYIDNIKKISGDKSIVLRPWMHKGGWCLEDETFDYNSSFNPDGYSVRVEAEPFDIKDGEDSYVAHSLTMWMCPVDFTDDICQTYDIGIHEAVAKYHDSL